MKERVILHCDMNCYYASVEMVLNPQLKGLAMAVGGSVENRRGIILAKSQKAKEAGVKTGEVIAEARAKCPELVVVPPHYESYIAYSKKAREIYYRYTDQVESFGLDECWLDLTASQKLFGSGREVADELRRVMKDELGLTISVGVSFNKVFAKLGSDLKKPDAVTEIRKQDVAEKVWCLPVEALLGVGPATTRKLNSWGITQIGELAAAPPQMLQRKLGIRGYRLWRWANGWDDGRVQCQGESQPIKSIGHMNTLLHDIYSKPEFYQALFSLSQEVSRRLRLENLKAGGIQVTVKTSGFHYQEIATALPYPTRSSVYLARAAYALSQRKLSFKEGFRAIGIRAIALIPDDQPLQLNFFSDAETLTRLENLEEAIFQLREKYGYPIITRGSVLKDPLADKNIPWAICPPGIPEV